VWVCQKHTAISNKLLNLAILAHGVHSSTHTGVLLGRVAAVSAIFAAARGQPQHAPELAQARLAFGILLPLLLG
jgi:hypothetical protein